MDHSRSLKEIGIAEKQAQAVQRIIEYLQESIRQLPGGDTRAGLEPATYRLIRLRRTRSTNGVVQPITPDA